MAIEIVDFPSNSMVIFNSYVKLPEGKKMGKNLGNTSGNPALSATFGGNI